MKSFPAIASLIFLVRRKEYRGWMEPTGFYCGIYQFTVLSPLYSYPTWILPVPGVGFVYFVESTET